MENKKKNVGNSSNWVGVGTGVGAAIFALTREPVWIAIGVALGAAICLLYTSPSPRDRSLSRMPSSA